MITFYQFLKENIEYNKIRLWRASNNNKTFEGMSLAEDIETAEIYLNNPGFGGNTIYFTNVDYNNMNIIELENFHDLCRAMEIEDWDECNDLVFRVDGGNIAGAIPQLKKVREKLKQEGYDWVKVAEDYPYGTTTWQPISQKAVESINIIKYEDN